MASMASDRGAGNETPARPKRMLTLASGGWVLLLATVMTIAIAAWALSSVFFVDRPPGDGRNPETYGFDLSNLKVDRSVLVAGQARRDMLMPLVNPPVLSAEELRELEAPKRSKFLVTSDRIVGVRINGEARAYPLSILNVHEIINDTLGGRAIVVTYSPLCDSVAVFDRSENGRTNEFGISGLVFNSNTLMYDMVAGLAEDGSPSREAAGQGTESLWCQLTGEAVAGPAAERGGRLRLMPCELVTWGRWISDHPATSVVMPNPVPRLSQRYRKTNYRVYFNATELMYPTLARDEIESSGRAMKSRVVAVTVQGREGDAPHREVFAFADLATRADEDGWVSANIAGRIVRFRHQVGDPPTVGVEFTDAQEGDAVQYAMWFAWRAIVGP